MSCRNAHVGPKNDVDYRRLLLTGDNLVPCNRYVDMDIAFRDMQVLLAVRRSLRCPFSPLFRQKTLH
jgi:hypothetical protein